MPCLKQTEPFCLASITFSWNEIFYLLRILTIIAEVVTIKPRHIGGNLTFLFFFLQVTVGNAIALSTTTTMYKELGCGQSSVLFRLTSMKLM